MSPIPTDPYNFSAGAVADAEQVDARFAPLYAALNGALDQTNRVVPKVLAAYLATDGGYTSGQLIVLSNAEFDTGGWFNGATGLYTPLVAGYYRMSWAVRSGPAEAFAGTWQTRLVKNGVENRQGSVSPSPQVGPTLVADSVGSAIVTANGSTDTFGIAVLHNKGSAAVVAGGAGYTHLHAELLGRS